MRDNKIAEKNKVGNICEFEGMRSIQRKCLQLKDELANRLDYTVVNDEKLKEIVSSKSKAGLHKILKRERESCRGIETNLNRWEERKPDIIDTVETKLSEDDKSHVVFTGKYVITQNDRGEDQLCW